MMELIRSKLPSLFSLRKLLRREKDLSLSLVTLSLSFFRFTRVRVRVCVCVRAFLRRFFLPKGPFSVSDLNPKP